MNSDLTKILKERVITFKLRTEENHDEGNENILCSGQDLNTARL